MSNTAVKIKKETKKPRISIGRKITGWMWALLIFLLGGGFIVYYPRPTVPLPHDPVDENNPFSALFTILNSGFIPLSDVTAGMAPGKVTIGKDSFVDIGGLNDNSGLWTTSEWQHHYLGMDESFTITPADLLNALHLYSKQISEADIGITVEYRPWFVPFHLHKLFRFELRRQPNGRMYWSSQSKR